MAMVGPGQEMWNHACDLCCEIQKNVSGVSGASLCFMSAAHIDISHVEALCACVCDGVCLGHPCCGEHDCQHPLQSQHAHFCNLHSSQNDICAITTCSHPVDLGFQTCSIPEHWQLEDVGAEEHCAMFQLCKCLECINTSHVEDLLLSMSTATPATDEEVEIDDQGTCEGKSSEGNTKPRARFGCCQTHNEQLCVTTCGVILGHATFFGSEGIYGVLVCHQFHHLCCRMLTGITPELS